MGELETVHRNYKIGDCMAQAMSVVEGLDFYSKNAHNILNILIKILKIKQFKWDLK